MIEPNKDGTYDLDLGLSVVANVIADTDFTTGTHVLDSQDIWIADTGATCHVTKHKEGGQKHYQTSVPIRGFAGETIQPDCKMDIPVTYFDKNGTKKFDVILGDIQTNEKFHYNLFSVGKMLLKGYKLEGDRHLFTMANMAGSIVFDILIHTRNGVLFCAQFTRTLEGETASAVIQENKSIAKAAKQILKVNIKRIHDCLGHVIEASTCKIAEQLGMVLS